MASHNTESPETPEDPGENDANATTATETKLVIEFTIPAGAFLLADTLQEYSDRTVEFEQIVPTHEQILPYLWATNGGDDAGFEEALRDDTTVANFRRVVELDGGALYQIDWTDMENGILGWIQDRDATMLQSEGEDDEWILKLRVESRDALGDFQNYCRDHDIDFELIRLYELTDPKFGQFNVTEKQREILITALDMGYFEIPRDVTLEEVAEAMDITKRAASERIRRGHTNLVNNTLTIGQPTGIGLGTGSL